MDKRGKSESRSRIMEKKGLFVRESSGLVREVSTLRAFFFNIGASVAWSPALLPSFVAFVPAWLLFGWSSVSWGIIVAGIFTVGALAPINMYLAMALPRSGGEQVYTPRITNPFLGFIETWTFVFSIFALMGFGLFLIILLFQNSFSIMAMSASEPWNSYGSWLGGTTGTLVTGTVVMLFVLTVSLLPSRRFHAVNSVLVAVGLVLTALVFPFIIGIDPTVFAHNFQTVTGKSVQDVLDLVSSQGFSVGVFAISTLGLVLSSGLTQFAGFQYSGFMAGELKGKISRNIIYSMIGAGIITILLNTFFLQGFVNLLGYDFLAALSYLFWNSPANAPILPSAQMIVAIGKPELGPLMAISVFGSVLIGASLFITWISTATRTAFAWSMDRLIPTKLSELNPRTKSPLYLSVIFVAFWYVSFLAAVYGTTFISGSFASALLAMFVWIVPGINAILLPYRRRDLYELIPKSMRRQFGIPLVSIFGIIWLVFAVPVYFLYAIWPLLAGAYGLHMTSFVVFAESQGLVTFGIILLAGIVIYFVSKWYNTRKGVDMDLLFKTVPPE